jgi:DGQHR domain-containing protein
MDNTGELRLPALEIRQGPNRAFYSFAVDGKMLPSFTTVSRIRRAGGSSIVGYQRPEILSHICEIRKYLESSEPLMPNALVIAFDKRVRFEPEHLASRTDYSRFGTIVIPLVPDQADEDKPGWIVDGQQRIAAIREAAVNRIPVCVNAFIAADQREQREQFILVNSTKPLPKGLIYELLPETGGMLPSALQKRRFPAQLLARLNCDDDSPLRGIIRTPTTPEGVVQDNSILKMLENSLSDGVLYRYREPGVGQGDIESMLHVVKEFWSATAHTFPKAWGLPPARSRLMHGAGVVSMGFLMDAISERHRQVPIPREEHFLGDLTPLRSVCRWTEGYWEFGPGVQRKWNEIQNTPKDVQLLSNYLMVQYKSLVWNRPPENLTT